MKKIQLSANDILNVRSKKKQSNYLKNRVSPYITLFRTKKKNIEGKNTDNKTCCIKHRPRYTVLALADTLSKRGFCCILTVKKPVF